MEGLWAGISSVHSANCLHLLSAHLGNWLLLKSLSVSTPSLHLLKNQIKAGLHIVHSTFQSPVQPATLKHHLKDDSVTWRSFSCMLLVASEGLKCTNRSALMCSFYLENKKYRFFGHSPLPMKEFWAKPVPMVWQAVCTGPEYIFTTTCWSVITSDSNFMFSSCREQSELRPFKDGNMANRWAILVSPINPGDTTN